MNEYQNERKKWLDQNTLLIYCDGGCLRNGKSNAKAGFGVFFGDSDSRNQSKPLIGKKQTNNEAELAAVKEIFTMIPEDQKVVIRTDSTFVIQTITKWMDQWKSNDWKKKSDHEPPKNLETIKEIDLLWTPHRKKNTVFEYVQGHSKNYGNDMADQLASEGIQKKS
jgi:ribonuclease HI